MYKVECSYQVYRKAQILNQEGTDIHITSTQLLLKNWGRFYVRITARNKKILSLGTNTSPIAVMLDGEIRTVSIRCNQADGNSYNIKFSKKSKWAESFAVYECKLLPLNEEITDKIDKYEFLIPNANLGIIKSAYFTYNSHVGNIIANYVDLSFSANGNMWRFCEILEKDMIFYLSDESDHTKDLKPTPHVALQLLSPGISQETALQEARRICTILNLASGKLLHPLLMSVRNESGKRIPIEGFCYASPIIGGMPFVHHEYPGDVCIIDFIKIAYPIATADWNWWKTTLILYGTMGEAQSPITKDIINCIFIERIFNYISSKNRGEKNKSSRMPEFEKEMRTLLKHHFPTWDESRIKGAITNVKQIDKKKPSYAEQIAYLEEELGYEAPKQKISLIRNCYFHRGQSSLSKEEELRFTYEFVTYITKLLLKMMDYHGKTTKFWHCKIL